MSYTLHRMSLSQSQSLTVAAVLEDCSDQLDIVGHTLMVQISRERGAAAVQVSRTVFITCSQSRGTSVKQLSVASHKSYFYLFVLCVIATAYSPCHDFFLLCVFRKRPG